MARKACLPLKMWLQVDLVTIYHRLAFFPGGHQRGKASNRTVPVLHEDVSEVRRLHFGELLRRMPASARGFIVTFARFCYEVEAGPEVFIVQVPSSLELDAIILTCPRMRPGRAPRKRSICAARGLMDISFSGRG